MSKFKVTQLKRIVGFDPNWAFPELELQLEFTDDYEMMDKAWSKIEEVPYCFSKSSAKFQSHMGQQIADFDPKWACPDCNLTYSGPVDLRKWAIFNTIMMSPKFWLSQKDLDAGCEHSLVPVDS